MATATPSAPSPFRDWLQKRGTPRRGWEKMIEWSLLSCGLFSIVVTVAIAAVILFGSFEFFTKERIKIDTPEGKKSETVWMTAPEIWDRFTTFFFDAEWNEYSDKPKYAIWPLLSATLMVTLIAAAVALPIGVLTATFLSEYATPRVRAIAKPTLELLAGIPTVVYGFFAIMVVTPALAMIIPELGNPHNLLGGGIVVGIMIIPMVASLSEDSLRAVPRALRDGAIALGANKFETSVKVVIPAGLSGVVASFILAISRAIGETMAVTLACGETAKAVSFFGGDGTRSILDPREGAATMTSYIVHRATGDVEHGSTDFNSLFAVAAVLFFMTLAMNVIAQGVLRRYRQVYQ